MGWTTKHRTRTLSTDRAVSPGPSALGARALSHPRRRRLYDLISGSPGIHLRELSRTAGMELGVLRSHLDVLLRHGAIVSRRAGRRRIYFHTAYRGPRGRSRGEALLEEIDRNPGVTLGQLAERSGCSRMLVHYHLRRLRARGQVAVERAGRTLRLLPGPRRKPFAHRLWIPGVDARVRALPELHTRRTREHAHR